MRLMTDPAFVVDDDEPHFGIGGRLVFAVGGWIIIPLHHGALVDHVLQHDLQSFIRADLVGLRGRQERLGRLGQPAFGRVIGGAGSDGMRGPGRREGRKAGAGIVHFRRRLVIRRCAAPTNQLSEHLMTIGRSVLLQNLVPQ